MRRDILDLMADELNDRQVSKLASFYTFDESSGRRKLDGMAAGKKWDMERSQKEFERENADILKFARRFHTRNFRKRRVAEDADAWLAKERAKTAAWRAANPDKVAKSNAEQRPRKRVRSRERYRENPERHRAAVVLWMQANPERVKQIREAYKARDRELHCAYYEANKEAIKANARARYAAKKDAINARARAAYAADKATRQAKQRAYYENNREAEVARQRAVRKKPRHRAHE